MEEIYSEEGLVNEGKLPWGQWKFSMSEEEIECKLVSLPKLQVDNNKDCIWQKLFSVLQDQSNSPEFGTLNEVPITQNILPTPMECSSTVETEEPMDNDTEDGSIEDITIYLVDLCNQVAPKLRLGISTVREDMKSFNEDVCKIKDNSLTSVMINAWSQLSSDASRLCFFIPFTSSSHLCRKLCDVIIKPWFSKSSPSKIEQLSEILSVEGDTVCHHLVAPLLQIENSPLAKDTMTLEELMSSMTDKHWATLLREILSDLKELHKWQIPLLATIVEHAKPSSDELHRLVQLMSSSGTMFAQSRDFGALLVAVAKCLSVNELGLISQLKLIAQNYKGPLKFKALKILEDVQD